MYGPFSGLAKNERSNGERYAVMDAALRSLLDWYAEMGVDVPKVPAARPVRAKSVAQKTKTPSQGPAHSIAASTDLSKVKSLDALHAALNLSLIHI